MLFTNLTWKAKVGVDLVIILLFYIPKEVMATGEVIFDTELIKMKVDIKMAENMWKKALKLLNGDCPTKSCEWYEKV